MRLDADYIVVGSGPTAWCFVRGVLSEDATARIVVLEGGHDRGTRHVQAAGSGSRLEDIHLFGVGTSRQDPWGSGQPEVEYAGIGGQSVAWAGWSPRPTDVDVVGWPGRLREDLFINLARAESYLGVESAAHLRLVSGVGGERVYGELQARLEALLRAAVGSIRGRGYVEPARLALARNTSEGLEKFVAHWDTVLSNGFEGAGRLPAGSAAVIPGCFVSSMPSTSAGRRVLVTTLGELDIGQAPLILANGTQGTARFLRASACGGESRHELWAHIRSGIVVRFPAELMVRTSSPQLGAARLVFEDTVDQSWHVQASAVSGVHSEKDFGWLQANGPDIRLLAPGMNFADVADNVVLSLVALASVHWPIVDRDFKSATPGRWAKLDVQLQSALRALVDELGGRVEFWEARDEVWRPGYPMRVVRFPKLVHESSSAPMADSEAGCVDTGYRLKGLPLTHAVGASVWPTTCGSTNPTLALCATALGLAARLV